MCLYLFEYIIMQNSFTKTPEDESLLPQKLIWSYEQQTFIIVKLGQYYRLLTMIKVLSDNSTIVEILMELEQVQISITMAILLATS